MSKEAIKELNNLLRGCEMGIENYQRYAEDTNDHKLRELFKEYKNSYVAEVGELAERVSELGGEPKYGSGIPGVMASISYAAKGVDGHGAAELLKTAHYGETMALEGCEKLIDMQNVDDKTKDLIRCQISDIKDRQEELVKLIREYHNKDN